MAITLQVPTVQYGTQILLAREDMAREDTTCRKKEKRYETTSTLSKTTLETTREHSIDERSEGAAMALFRRAIAAFRSFEEDYVQALESVMEAFPPKRQQLLNSARLKILLGQIGDLLHHHQIFLASLQSQDDNDRVRASTNVSRDV